LNWRDIADLLHVLALIPITPHQGCRMNPTSVLSPDHQETESVIAFIQKLRERIATVVVGQDVVVERLLIALFTGGHLLLQGVPGLAKTLLVSVLS
jgi:MoxR-like ATPase